MAESQAPLLQLNQFLPYLKDHLLLDKNVDGSIIKPFIQTDYGKFRLPRYVRCCSQLPRIPVYQDLAIFSLAQHGTFTPEPWEQRRVNGVQSSRVNYQRMPRLH